MAQKHEIDSLLDNAEEYEMKPRQAKSLANDLMFPMVDFQTHMDVQI